MCVCFQLKMVLIKCCDISNEVRPTEVAEPWVDCLLEEYFMQVSSSDTFTFSMKPRSKACEVTLYCEQQLRLIGACIK